MTAAPGPARAADGRILSLDLLRGVAALTVVLLHLDLQWGDAVRVPGGYLAVDFFFLLSGFVIATAYERRLAGGLGLRAFLLLRLVRLYPLYLLGLVLGLVALAWRPADSFAGGLDGTRLGTSVLLNAVLLPTPLAHQLFPFNLPAWSLFLEVGVNVMFAATLFRWRRRWLWALIVAGAAATIVGGWWLDSLAGGFNRSTAPVGAARCLFSFTLGAVLFRSGLAECRTVSGGRLALVTLVLLLPMVWPVAIGSPWRLPLDLVAVLLVFPAVLLLAVRTEPPAMLRRASAVAGDLSYPLYAIHSPLLALLFGAGQLPGVHGTVDRTAALLVTLGAAWVAARWYDAPVRAWISRRLRTRESARPRALA